MLESKRIMGLALGVALGMALALPAGAGTLYAWRTDDGGYAFADDLKRVPERYRDRVETREMAGLASYSRFTPQDDDASSAEVRELRERLADLRERNRQLERQVAGTAPRPAGEEPVSVRFTDDGEAVVQVPATTDARGPVVIEKQRMLPENGNRTRTNTIVRRGDEIIAIVRPVKPQTDLLFPDEESFEKR